MPLCAHSHADERTSFTDKVGDMRDGDNPHESPNSRWDPRSSGRGVGCMVGGGFWVLWLVTLFGLYEVDARSDTGGISSSWFVLWFVLAAALCLVALVMTMRRSTRLFGQGMLLGVATLFFVGIVVLMLQVAFTPG
jgi:hypothetical protein